MGGLRLEGEEVPEVVVGRLTGWHLVVRFGLHGVNKVGELHGILDEEHWNVVSMGVHKYQEITVSDYWKNIPDDVPITLRGVKFGSKSADISHGIRTTSRSLDGREAYEHWCGS